jgi:transcriptional regulator with XRE-family HTH domain
VDIVDDSNGLTPMTSFRSWLLDELRIRHWTQSDLADRLGVNRSAVAKWVAPPGTSSFRQPSYESCRLIADVFGIPQDLVLEKAGLTPARVDSTDLQQKVMALIPHIPDDLLRVIYHQLVPMVDEYVQQQIMTSWKEPLNGRHGMEQLSPSNVRAATATADVA